MSQRVRNWCLAGLSTLTIAALAASIVWPQPGGEDDWPWAVGMMAFPVSAALILAKRPGNTIGRVLGVVALASLSIFGTSLYVGSYPTGQLSLWAEVLNVISVVPLFGGLIVLLYVYPTGEPVNRIFRRVLVVFVVVISLTSLVTLLAPGPLVYTQRENPAGILPEWTRPLVDAGGVWDGAFVVFILLGLASLVVRWRRADNTERAQLRWFATASVVAVVTLFLLTDDQGESAGAALDVVFGVLVAAGLFWSIPAAIVVAVTRYRLFDIDRLISRTVTYALVAGMAGIVFATIAIGLPRLLGVPDESPPILVAGATLAAAALFNPFRRRIQARVDRRFNRARYNAQREVDQLVERLQGDLELDALSEGPPCGRRHRAADSGVDVDTGAGMTASTASSVVWPVWVVTLVSVVAGRVVVNAGSQDLQFLIFGLITGSVGAVLASRIPSNPTGWVLFVVGVWLAARSLVPSWFRAEGRVGDAAWVTGWAWIPPLVLLLILMPLIFPDGRLLSARWRPVALAAGIGGVAYTLYAAFGPYLGSSSQEGANPYHVPGVATGLLFLSLLTIPAWVGAVASMVARFRGSRGIVRQQIKFVVYSLCAPSSALLLAWGVAALLGELTMRPTASLFVWVVVSFIPVAIGVAVLKYRLDDIDRLISRTVSYGLVVATLGAVFVAVAIGLPQLAGVASNEPILVAAATLAVATLFNPLRRRTQARVDRRFNRARYDAEREVESFAERLRTELELDEVSDELIAVVAKTMHPTSARVWIQEAQP